jgi:hypothetical protein
MRFQLRDSGWAISPFYIPEGTIIDSASTFPPPNDPAFASHLGTYRWSQLAAGLNPPLNAQPLDQTTYDTMKSIYEPLGMTRWIITMQGADGIIR